MKFFQIAVCLAALVPTAMISARTASASTASDSKACSSAESNPREGIAACSRLLQDRPRGLKVAMTYELRSAARFILQDYDGAVNDANQVLNLLGPDKFAYNLRALAESKRGEADQALADVAAALRLDPKFPQAFVTRSVVHFEQHDYDAQIEDLNIAEVLDPKNVDIYNNRGVAYQYKGLYDRAIADFDHGAAIKPTASGSFMNRGRTRMMQGDLVRAVQDLDIAVKVSSASLTEDHDLSFVIRGDVRRYRGEFQLALNDYDSALRIRSDFIPAFTGKGLTYEKMGRLDLARMEFAKAVQSQSLLRNSDYSAESLLTAQSRLAALDSGVAQPIIQPVPISVTSPNSVPTPTAQPAKPAAIPRPSERRVALVIGNSAYINVPELANPEKDATAVATTLRNIGFEVTLVTNVTREKMINALRDFADAAEKSDWAMVYYAGHGMEVGGVNYLIPTDAKIAVDRDIQYETVPLTQVLNAADSAKKIKLVMLDACRDNPFKPRRTLAPAVLAESTAGAPITTRSVGGRGLAEVKVNGASLVVYAAKDGQVALDGDGGNSPFAVAVVQRIATPGVEINKVFRLVRDDVMEATGARQEPYTYGSLPGSQDFYFVDK